MNRYEIQYVAEGETATAEVEAEDEEVARSEIQSRPEVERIIEVTEIYR